VQDLAGCTTSQLGPNDDGSTVAVPLPFTLDFYDSDYTEAYVNNNGNVTFTDALSDYTPYDFTITGDVILAPFFADVDTTGAGSGLVNYGPVTYNGAPAWCVIWDNVGYYNSRVDKLNRFQLIIADQADGFDLIFNYDTIQWETGEADGGVDGLGGIPAAAGWSSGDGDPAHSAMLPGSLAAGGLLDSNVATGLAHASNVGVPGRFIWQIRGVSTGGRLTGTVTTDGTTPVAQSPVEVCRTGGSCVTRLTNTSGVYRASGLAAGDYTVTAYPGPDGGGSPATEGPEPVTVGAESTLDVTLGPDPIGPPDGTTITNIGTAGNDVPVVYWSDPLTLSTTGCAGGTVSYEMVLDGEVVRSGAMTEGPAGNYTATIAPLQPNTGTAFVTIEITCPNPLENETIEFGVYIDPSGFVRDSLGNPIEDATVQLLRSSTAAGPFFPVPDGSALMSPSNRTNPDLTDSSGHFGWDVVAGFYVVRAFKDGCVSAADRSVSFAASRVMDIPPPVTDLDLRLYCGEGGGGGGGGGGTTPPPGRPPAGPSTPQQPRPSLGKLDRLKLVRGRLLQMRFRCSPLAVGACNGRVTVRLKRKTIATASFRNVRPGRAKVVKVQLSRKSRALLRRQKRRYSVAVAIAVRDRAAGRQTLRRSLTVRP